MTKVLVIDDDDEIRQLLRHLLEEAGYQVIEAANGTAGIRCAEREHPQLLIVDMLMPEKEGLETISEIRVNMKDVKILAISGGGRTGNMGPLKIAKQMGADGVLAKPFKLIELRNAVSSLLDA